MSSPACAAPWFLNTVYLFSPRSRRTRVPIVLRRWLRARGSLAARVLDTSMTTSGLRLAMQPLLSSALAPRQYSGYTTWPITPAFSLKAFGGPACFLCRCRLLRAARRQQQKRGDSPPNTGTAPTLAAVSRRQEEDRGVKAVDHLRHVRNLYTESFGLGTTSASTSRSGEYVALSSADGRNEGFVRPPNTTRSPPCCC